MILLATSSELIINFCELPNFACMFLSKKLLAVGPGQTDRTLTFLFLLCSSSSSNNVKVLT